ncbi:MAG: hypothetical protein LVS60_19690 [Nodosilinea sp. LVE1205-7]
MVTPMGVRDCSEDHRDHEFIRWAKPSRCPAQSRGKLWTQVSRLIPSDYGVT